ncbi:MAG: hypothetical protein RL518_316 [Pseudomonadota bacterium]
MSLISGANFVAPLRSKVQIVGIFAIAALVAVLRLAGSAHSTEDSREASLDRGYGQVSAKSTMASDDVDSYLAARRRTKARSDGARSDGARSDGAAAGDVTVEKLLQGGQDSDSGQEVFRGSDKEAPAQPEKLNDIKRSLGLE